MHLNYQKLSTIKIQFENKSTISPIFVANTMTSRCIGLMNMPLENPILGLLLDPCNSIHTFWMKFPIDCLFLNRHNKIIKIIHHLEPWRMTRVYFTAAKVIELRANLLDKNIMENQQVHIECLN